VHYWADLQSVHGLRCYGSTRNAWQSPAVIHQAHRTPHALRMPAKTALAGDNACCVRDVICHEAVPFRPYCGDVVTRTRNVSEYMLVIALCLVDKQSANNIIRLKYIYTRSSLYAAVRPSVACLSVVGNARAPYSGSCNFRQYFYDI